MNRFKLQSFISEFPFITEILGDKTPDSVRIKRADENLLKLAPKYRYHDGSAGVSTFDEQFHFVLLDGTVITNAVQQEGHISSNYAHSQDRSWEGESVLESIDRHGVAGTLQFIVQDTYDLHDWSGSEYFRSCEINIYKPPKDTTFGAEIEKAKARALAEVRAEADF